MCPLTRPVDLLRHIFSKVDYIDDSLYVWITIKQMRSEPYDFAI